MAIRLLTSADDLATYDAWVRSHPDGSLWQSLAWKTYQEALGREVRLYVDDTARAIHASAMVVIDRTIGGFSTWDIAKGPLFDGSLNIPQVQVFFGHILEDARKDACMSLYFSPSHLLTEDLGTISRLRQSSDRCEQSPATRIIDLTQTEEQILAQMHQKGRYNIKVAAKNGVTVREGTTENIDAFYELLQSTSKRDVFSISPKSHYVHFLEDLPESFFLLAIHDGVPVAGFLGVMWNKTGYYYYGASDHNKRSFMAPYALQWEAMKRCKAAGCIRYDLLGIAPPDSPNDHHWAGISDFKIKFGGSVVTYPCEQEIVLHRLMKNIVQMKRKIMG